MGSTPQKTSQISPSTLMDHQQYGHFESHSMTTTSCNATKVEQMEEGTHVPTSMAKIWATSGMIDATQQMTLKQCAPTTWTAFVAITIAVTTTPTPSPAKQSSATKTPAVAHHFAHNTILTTIQRRDGACENTAHTTLTSTQIPETTTTTGNRGTGTGQKMK